MLGEGLALGPLARKPTHSRRLGDSPFGRKFIFSRVRFQLFERQCQLVDQPRRALRPRTVDMTLQLGDLQLLVRDQRAVLRGLRTGHRGSATSSPFARSIASAFRRAATLSSSLLKNLRQNEDLLIQFSIANRLEAEMRGAFVDQGGLFSYIMPEARVPKNHPLRQIRELVREVLSELNRCFGRLYASEGRPSIPPEQLLSALLLQVFYGIRSERQLMEQTGLQSSVPLVCRPFAR